MPDITPERCNNLKDIVLSYLQGEAISVVTVRLQVECAESEESCSSLYQSLVIKPDEEDPYIPAILGSLNIKKSNHKKRKGRYEKLLENSENIHELLTNLYHDGHHHLGNLLRLIENTKPKINWAVILSITTILSAIVGTLLYLYREYLERFGNWLVNSFPEIVSWFKSTFWLLRSIPLLGIIYNGCALLWNWYTTFANGTSTTADKLSRLFFKTLTAGLTISGYLITYFAEGVMTLPAAMLFVVSSSTEVFQSLFGYFRSLKALESLDPPEEHAPWEVLAEYERAKSWHELTLKSVWIKLSAAILTTIAVFIWNFFPPGLVLTICCFAVITLIALTKSAILAGIREDASNELQKKIKQLAPPLNPELNPANQNSLIKFNKMQKSLQEKKEELNILEEDLEEREEKLAIKQQAIIETLDAVAHGLSSPAVALALLQKDKPIVKTSSTPIKTASKPSPKEPEPLDEEEELFDHSAMTMS